MSKLSDFLTKNKIDSRRVLMASKAVEALRPDDRNIRLARKKARGGGDVPDAVKAMAEKKPRSGKVVTGPTLRSAMSGEAVSGAAKTRITRAVNHLLKQKKKSEVTFRELF